MYGRVISEASLAKLSDSLPISLTDSIPSVILQLVNKSYRFNDNLILPPGLILLLFLFAPVIACAANKTQTTNNTNATYQVKTLVIDDANGTILKKRRTIMITPIPKDEKTMKSLLIKYLDELKSEAKGKEMNVGIYVVQSADRDYSQWYAMLLSKSAGGNPEITINTKILGASTQKGSKPKKRRLIYFELAENEDKAMQEAKAKFGNAMGKPFLDFLDSRNASYREQIKKKYNLNENDLDEIYGEGYENNWPRPK